MSVDKQRVALARLVIARGAMERRRGVLARWAWAQHAVELSEDGMGRWCLTLGLAGARPALVFGSDPALPQQFRTEAAVGAFGSAWEALGAAAWSRGVRVRVGRDAAA